MKTKAQVLRDNPKQAKLIRAVLKRIDKANVSEINRVGANAGFGGFTYYADTHRFAMLFRKSILVLLQEDSDAFGEDIVKMVSQFNVFRKTGMDYDTRNDLYLYLGGGKPRYRHLTNLMTLYAVGSVCRMFEN